ncbi:hypothetical protein TGAM01_v201455 [Trichoderma gamsii]|uniref:Uncharacterized protein n=1 Tax=Trichoderma gamsii TaxID=398673 RepID=A0A2P5A0M3_9HYPO|nr:hypothetical protein TGAM01_v201455 [Trichoderma gamsii]PON30088.1 hypothetical protein TGAM01_v201455 [Trichoderma gamsii]
MPSSILPLKPILYQVAATDFPSLTDRTNNAAKALAKENVIYSPCHSRIIQRQQI